MAAAKRRVPLSREELARAAALYRGFHEKPPRRVRFLRARLPKVAMQIGRLEGVMYDADHGPRYRHMFRGKSRPYLVASPDGRTLVIVGGRFRMTARGIVDQ